MPRPTADSPLGAVVRGLAAFNDRHPWSHNDFFHPWILRNLPERRHHAVDVGCGEGALVAALASHFDRVTGIDVDAGMRADAARATRTLPHVTITDGSLADLTRRLSSPAGSDSPPDAGLPGVDLITMVAVLHHLDAASALQQVRDALAPGGRFLAVGLAAPRSAVDIGWDVASALTNPLIGLAKHPHPHRGPRPPDAFPTRNPEHSVDDLRRVLRRVLPGARLRRRLAFRYTIEWTRP
ncbi:class I SAM-dependent methyltransferase [Nigerium sp.]|uniref:class I SAM-dependent methyltransferase n=1 Tax=Nigerium sp. TaxID=2042655 RepID=UPI0032221F7F